VGKRRENLEPTIARVRGKNEVDDVIIVEILVINLLLQMT